MTFMEVKNEAWALSHPPEYFTATLDPYGVGSDRSLMEPWLSELTAHSDKRVSLLACAIAMRLGYWIPT